MEVILPPQNQNPTQTENTVSTTPPQTPQPVAPTVPPADTSSTPTATSMPTAAPQEASAPTQTGPELYTCKASYVTGPRTYLPGTLHLYQDRVVIASKAGATFIEIPYTDITEVNYFKNYSTRLFSFKTQSGVYVMAPFRTNASSPWYLAIMIVGVIAIQQTLSHLSAAATAIAIPILLIIAAISFVRYYRQLATTTHQIATILKQHVSVVNGKGI